MHFNKPTLEEVKLAMAKAGLPEIEAQKFCNYYESNGWRVGKSPMKSWPHAVANWRIRFVERGGNLIAPTSLEIPRHIADMHRAYEQVSGMAITMTPERLAAWESFLKFRTPPFTAEDVRIVVKQIKFEIKHKNSKRLYGFRNLIGQPAFFEEDLGRATAALRPPQPLTLVVQAGPTQRIISNPGTGDATRPVADVIAAMRAAVG